MMFSLERRVSDWWSISSEAGGKREEIGITINIGRRRKILKLFCEKLKNLFLLFLENNEEAKIREFMILWTLFFIELLFSITFLFFTAFF
tara:strand:+ start:181 stop:450 length:270 start_codon:yes stop_codon:yes gene_type:complete